MNRLTVASLPAAAFGVAFLFSAGTPPAQPIPSGPVLHAAAPLPAMAVPATTPRPVAHEPRAAKRKPVRRTARRRAAKRQPARRPAPQAAARVVMPVATATATATAAPPPPPATPKPKPKPAATPAQNFDSSGGFDSQG
jgi:Meckel syndrome type 1 protein